MTVFICAEAGINAMGDRSKMLALCDAAKQAGADAVKVQAYNAEALVKRRGKGDLALLKQCELSDDDLDAIAAHCKAIGLKWFASVFDPSQVERVLSRGACALKIGHAEAWYSELVSECQRAVDHYMWRVPDAERVRYPLYVSYQVGHNPHETPADVTRVLCVCEYPAKSQPKLLEIIGGGHQCWGDESAGFDGFSSHYTDYRIPAAAALRGAEYIEAHLRLSDTDPEAAWSLSVEDFGKMVKLIREYEGWL